MKGVLTLALAAANPTTVVEECPVKLVLEITKLKQREAGVVNKYAQCMSTPYVPLVANFSAKKAECRRAVAGDTGERAALALSWVDNMAVEFEGCETDLKIKRK